MNRYRILPTDPRFQRLTTEQIDFLVEVEEASRPKEADDGETIVDDGFDEAQAQAMREDSHFTNSPYYEGDNDITQEEAQEMYDFEDDDEWEDF